MKLHLQKICSMLNLKEIFSASLVLFAVIDIIGNIPLIISLRGKVGHIQSEKASLVAALIMIGFLFLGEEILKLIGIDINSFAVAGSFVILFLALEMILGITLYKDDIPETASIVPLAFPMIAGAGTMTSLLSLRAEYQLLNIILGTSGINIIRKVFGIVLLAIAVKLFTTNIGQLI
jgi:multiple antibiotic resistance protein